MSQSSAGAASPTNSADEARRLRDLPYLVLFRAMWRAQPAMATAYVGSCLLLGLVPVAAIFATGSVIGSLPTALREGMTSHAAHRVEFAAGALCALFFFQQLFGSVQTVVAETVGGRLDARLRERVMTAIAVPRTTLHLEDPVILEAISRATTVGTARYGPSTALWYGGTAISGQVTGYSLAIVLGTFRWWLTPMLLAVWLIVRRYMGRETLELYRVMGFQTGADRRGGYFRDLAFSPAAAKEIRIFGLGTWIANVFHDTWSGSMGTILADRRRMAAPMWALAPLVAISHGVALYVLIDAARHGDVQLQTLTIMIQAISGVATIGNAGRDDVVVAWGAATIPEVERLEATLRPHPAETETARQIIDLPNSAPDYEIRFEKVGFAYPGHDANVFTDLDLVIPAGKSLAVVGNNGTGKTTLVKMLAGLIEPTAGRVTVDGFDLSTVEIGSWRKHVSVVFQDFVHYEISARDNIRVGAWDVPADEAAIALVADRAGLTRVLEALPVGLDTTLSRRFTNGVDLSGGEWQRVALARALWAVRAGANLLVLDEPTANLDVRSEAAFYDRFLEITQGLTTIVISHRFSTVRQADLIAVLDNGLVRELGSHHELIEHAGLYARMFSVQSMAFATEASMGRISTDDAT